jgi:thioredoxin-related protein
MTKIFTRLVISAAILSFAPVINTHASEVETLAQAKQLSAKTGKPILLQFYHDDCEYCDQAARDAETDASLKLAFERVVHLNLGVLQDQGAVLAATYRVGNYYPVFVLTDSTGNTISRWTGYTGVDRFIKSFNQAMSDMMTVDERIARCEANPTPKDALFLADFFTDTREYLVARDYLRLLQRLYGEGLDFSYRLFTVIAEAVWNDLLPFDSLITAADDVRAKGQMTRHNLGQMAQTMANVARKTNHTDKLESYLMAGIEATASRTDEAGIELHRDLLADYALHAMGDTTEALRVKKLSLGEGWEKDLAKCFQFGEWCFRRNINLADAEHYVRLATEKASGDKFRATHLRMLAEICFARGKTEEAIDLANQALALDPSAVWFEKELTEWREGK